MLESAAVIVGAGIDIVEIVRVERALSRRGSRLRERVFTQREVRECGLRRRSGPHFALRFAAKEAGMKALGTGWRGGVGWHDFEMIEAADGLELQLTGRSLELAHQRGFERAWLGTSLTRTHALVQVVLEGPARAPRPT